jgi:hypothetical protein
MNVRSRLLFEQQLHDHVVAEEPAGRRRQGLESEEA